jgi:hypothetical protein
MTVANDKLRMMFISILLILALQMVLTAFGINLVSRAS